MRGGTAVLMGVLALAVWPWRAPAYVPENAVMLFAPGSAEISQAARDALLAFLRPPRPGPFRGQCIVAHADRGPGAAALARARADAVAAMMTRQGVNRADIAIEARGDASPAKLAAPGAAEPMNDRVELAPCPGPRLAGVAAAEAIVLDAAIVPTHVAAMASMIARALGCQAPEVPRDALALPAFDCPPEVPPQAVPAVTVARVDGSRRIAVTLEWPAGIGAAPDRARAAAGAVLDHFGLAPGTALAALGGGAAAGSRLDIPGRGLRAEVAAGPGALRRLRIVPTEPEGP